MPSVLNVDTMKLCREHAFHVLLRKAISDMPLKFDENGNYVTWKKRRVQSDTAPPEDVVLVEPSVPSWTWDFDSSSHSDWSASTCFTDKTIRFYMKTICSPLTVRWANILNKDICEYMVGELTCDAVHEMIHAIGLIRHNRSLTQFFFDKLVSLMGHDSRMVEQRWCAIHGGKPVGGLKKLEKIVVNLE